MPRLEEFANYYNESRQPPSYTRAVRVKDASEGDVLEFSLGMARSGTEVARAKWGYTNHAGMIQDTEGLIFVWIAPKAPPQVYEAWESELSKYERVEVTPELLERVRVARDRQTSIALSGEVRRRLDPQVGYEPEERVWAKVMNGIYDFLRLRRLK